jgi:creatinine amidohydrolase
LREEDIVRPTRREALRAGLAFPAMITAGYLEPANENKASKPKRFEEVAGFEVAQLVDGCAFAMLPLGSLEFHGPHNPLGSDSIIISGIAERVAARTNGLLFPTIVFTQCPAHTAHFRGTLSIRPDVMTMYFSDVLRSILRLGFRKVLVLNGHDGNIGPCRGAVAQVADEERESALLFASWWEFLPGELMKSMGLFHQANGGHGHGGPLETSAVAAFRPDLIHLDQAKDLPEPPDLAGGAPYFLQKSVAADWPGYSGHVSESSADKGKQLIGISEDAIVKLIGNWLKHGEVPGNW